MEDILLPNSLMLFIVIVLTLGSIGVGVYRNRTFRRREKQFVHLAQILGLRLAYTEPRQFTFYGDYRNYPVRIEPFAYGNQKDKKQRKWATKITLPMVNPNLKILRISKVSPSDSEFNSYIPHSDLQLVQHQIAPWLDIHTNDSLFSHLVLTDDIKMDLVVNLKSIDSGIIYIMGDELGAIVPFVISDANDPPRIGQILDILCNIKDELNQY